MPVFERRRAFHERGSRDGFLHAGDMACGRSIQIAQKDERLWRVQRWLRLRFSRRLNLQRSNPAGPIAGFAVRSNATEPHADDWP